MKKFKNKIKCIVVILFFMTFYTHAQISDPVVSDREAERYPNVTETDERVIRQYVEMMTETRRNILGVYVDVMSGFIERVFRGTESDTHVNMGPVIANQVTTEIMSQLNRTTAGLPLFSRSYLTLRAMSQERERAASASERFSIIEYFQRERQHIQTELRNTFETDTRDLVLREFSSLPPDSDRTQYLIRLQGFIDQYRGNLSSLVPSNHQVTYNTIVRYLNASRVASGNINGYIVCYINVGNFIVTGNGNYDGLEASFPWNRYQSPRTVKFKVHAPMGELLEEELNRLKSQHPTALFRSVFDIQVVKVLVFEVTEGLRVDALPGATETIRYQEGVLGRNNDFRRGIIHPNQPIREALQGFYQYVETNEATYQQFNHLYTNPNWHRQPDEEVTFARRW